MSEHITSRGGTVDPAAEQAVDRLLADAGFKEARDVRAELLELRALAGTAPSPSAAVRALMVSEPATVTSRITTAAGGASCGAPKAGGAAPVDELAVRRGRKRRAGIASLAVVVSLAGGATAAAATEGGIPGVFHHLGAAIGSVVAPFSPGAGSPSQERPAAPPVEQPASGNTGQVAPGQSTPAQDAPGASTASPEGVATANPGSGRVVSPKTPANGAPHAPQVPAKVEPGNIAIPTPPVTPPGIDHANPVHPNVPIGPSNTDVVPVAPVDPTIPAR